MSATGTSARGVRRGVLYLLLLRHWIEDVSGAALIQEESAALSYERLSRQDQRNGKSEKEL